MSTEPSMAARARRRWCGRARLTADRIPASRCQHGNPGMAKRPVSNCLAEVLWSCESPVVLRRSCSLAEAKRGYTANTATIPHLQWSIAANSLTQGGSGGPSIQNACLWAIARTSRTSGPRRPFVLDPRPAVRSAPLAIAQGTVRRQRRGFSGT